MRKKSRLLVEFSPDQFVDCALGGRYVIDDVDRLIARRQRFNACTI
jgi:hypothetical protein